MKTQKILSLVVAFAIVAAVFATGSPTKPATVSAADNTVEVAGWRSSDYGMQDPQSVCQGPGAYDGACDVQPSYWVNAAQGMALQFPGSQPGGIYTVGYIEENVPGGPGTMMPAELQPDLAGMTAVGFSVAGNQANPETMLDAFDAGGLNIILGIEPGNADINQLATRILNKYKHHPSVVGFGVDIEWFKGVSGNVEITEAEVIAVRDAIEAVDPNYKTVIKHYDSSMLPPGVPRVIYLTDTCQFHSLAAAVDDYVAWANTFSGSQVGYQFGYDKFTVGNPDDQDWWGPLGDEGQPAKAIYDAMIAQEPNLDIYAIYWVDFTMLTQFPLDYVPPTPTPSTPTNTPTPAPTGTPTGEQTIFTSQTPESFGNDAAYELGTLFKATVDGQITKVRIYTNASEGGDHTVRLWRASDGVLVAGPYTWSIASGTTGWKTYTLPSAVSIVANTDYIVSVANSSDRYYARTAHGFDSPINNGNLVTYVGSGKYTTSIGSMPNSVWNNSNYFRDVVFVASGGCSNPGVPGEPTFSNVAASSLTVNWGDVANEVGYQVQRCQGAGCTSFANVGSQLAAGTTSFDDSGLTASTTYRYRIIAKAATGCSDQTGTASADVTTLGYGAIKLATGEVNNVGSSWQTVSLPNSYTSMVVVAAANYDKYDDPAVVQVRNASGNSFQVKVQNPTGGSLSDIYTVYYMVVEEGVYTNASDGVKMEAVKYNSTVTDRQGSWQAEYRSYSNSYSNPVVLGQVMTDNSDDWSAFWSRGSSRKKPPSPWTLRVGKHVGEDHDQTRADETVGYIVIEAGAGNIEGLSYAAGVGSDFVQGMGNSPPYVYSLSGLSSASVALVSQVAMDDDNGGWAVLYGANPFTASSLKLAIDEDQCRDSERSHSTEQVAYIIFE